MRSSFEMAPPVPAAGFPIIIGDYNQAAIAIGATNASAIRVVQNVGAPCVFHGLLFSYDAAAQAPCRLRLFDGYNNRQVIAGNVAFDHIGQDRVIQTSRSVFLLPRPIRLVSGQFVELFVDNLSGAQIDANDLRLSLVGIQETI